MQLNQDDFVQAVLDHLVQEHGCTPNIFDDLKSRISSAWEVEGRQITTDELTILAHGETNEAGKTSTPTDIEEKYPRLSEVFVLAYSAAHDAEQDAIDAADDEAEDDDDDDEDDESEDEEDSDDETED